VLHLHVIFVFGSATGCFGIPCDKANERIKRGH
jgi:hypothetical protein